jgi:predicted GNAT family acetyltransferase
MAQVVLNAAKSRFEMHLDGGVAVLDYQLRPGEIVLAYAGVPTQLRGHGLGSQIVKAALDYARAHRLTVIPHCSFVASYIAGHPEYFDLVAEEYRGRGMPR